jgi:hypothetical protein
MSATQLAEYWQLYNENNEPTTAGILKWAKRPADKFPLPHAYMGDLLRFNRDDVDRWPVTDLSTMPPCGPTVSQSVPSCDISTSKLSDPFQINGVVNWNV